MITTIKNILSFAAWSETMQPSAQMKYSHHDTEPLFCSFDDITDCCLVSLLLILIQTKEKPQHSTKPFLAVFLPSPHHVLVMSCEARHAMQRPEAARSERRRWRRGALGASGAAPTKGTGAEREARPGDVSPRLQAPATPT